MLHHLFKNDQKDHILIVASSARGFSVSPIKLTILQKTAYFFFGKHGFCPLLV
jgi:hypothetical protein